MSSDNFKYFPYIIQSIVESVREEYSGTEEIHAGTTPYFEFGTYLELTKQLKIKDQIDTEKYPLVWLVWEANESVQSWTSKTTYNVRPRLFIVTHTNSEYSSYERYDANFIGVLFPIWELFKSYLEYNKYISTSTAFGFEFGEHLLWGESLGFQKNKNVMFDTLDAIEIKFNNLEINNIC